MWEAIICMICGMLGGIIYGGIQHHEYYPYFLIGLLVGLILWLALRFGLDDDVFDIFDHHN